MNNFLNTFYTPTKNTIVMGTLSNNVDTQTDYIVYCEPENIPLTYLKTFLEGGYKKYLTFRTKRTLGKKVNLFLIFSILTTYTNKMDAQKYFLPYYENIIVKTTYWNILSESNFIKQLNLIYETTEPFTYDVVSTINTPEDFNKLIIDEFVPSNLNVEINYDLYSPEQSIRFVFQYQFS